MDFFHDICYTSTVFRNLSTKLGGWEGVEQESVERSSELRLTGVLGVAGCGVGVRVRGESLVDERFKEGEVDLSPRGMGRPFRVLL